jgi:ABC-type xylose transport system permease subunit
METSHKRPVRLAKVLSAVRHLTDFREFMILAVILLACVAMSIASPVFLTSSNVLATLLSLSIESIVAIAMTVLLVAADSIFPSDPPWRSAAPSRQWV